MTIRVKTTLAIVILFMSGGVIQLCFNSCGDAIRTRLTGVTFTGNRLIQDSRIFKIEELGNHSVSYDSMIVSIMPQVESLSMLNQRNVFFNSAYACTPAEDHDVIAEFNVITSTNYNDEFQAGESLQEILLLKTSGEDEWLAPNDFFLYHRPADRSIYYVKLSSPPNTNGVYDFIVSLKTIDGEVYSGELTGVNLRVD